jgi:drug/metabolite transporter (DMT)-like permease
MMGACISIAAFFPVYKLTWAENGVLSLSPSMMDWIYISILSLVCTVYAFSVMVELMKRVSVFFIQLTINLEPLYGMVMAVILFKEKEKMNVNFYIGTLIILSAVISYPFLKRKYAKHFID